MPLPTEALVPFGTMVALFIVMKVGYKHIDVWWNDGKPPRWSVDKWDRAMMERDRRLTGYKNGSMDDIVAPKSFIADAQMDCEIPFYEKHLKWFV